jgi:hypothetical protein
MKEQTQTIHKISFSYCSTSRTNPFISILKKRFTSCRNQLESGAASLGIGTVFLLAVYLFFTQLAAHGWQ